MSMGKNTSNPTLLDVRNLSVDYLAASGTVHAVTNVSLTLQRGEILGLAGESGCGKSTMAYAISRLLRPPAYITGGQVLYYPPTDKQRNNDLEVKYHALARKQNSKNGVENDVPSDAIDVLRLSPSQLRTFRWNEMAIVFQSAMNALNPVMTVGAQIIDVLQTHRPEWGASKRKQRAIELFNIVGISADRLRSYPHELSGGMRQRAVIAIALALQPELIIMDEPTTALDVVVQREILELIKSLCKELSTALIFITHDLSLLIELADKVAIMYAGKMVEKSTSQMIYQHPRHPYSYGLLHSFPSLHGPLERMGGIPGSPPDLRNVPSGCPFHPRCPFAFDACPEIVPSLRPYPPGEEKQLVACHLYDPQLNPAGPPTMEQFAAQYAAMTEESNV